MVNSIVLGKRNVHRLEWLGDPFRFVPLQPHD
jgi:hypothetical protein